MTRIIAGTARGRRLAVPATGTRPTTDRVREALFSSLDSELAASGRTWSQIRVLDLFAGTGALGLESLSRGAASAILVEKSRASAGVLAANAAAVGAAGAQVVIRDAWQVASLPVVDSGADLCFVDPPYEWPADDVRELLASLLTAGWLARDAIIVVERDSKDRKAPIPETWPEPRRRPYGDTVLWYGQATLAADGTEDFS
ncbi:MAG: 16S rRNA (guanine(966)-N(2))-methyltransferase RsmD [bacterium]|nr:16S rRNA (guanine(966)-N(2))-methyltransferase RsmD [bacterium]